VRFERVELARKEIERSIVIRPDQIESADRYVVYGRTYLMLGFTGPRYDLSPLEKLIARRDSRSRG
jgi:hypothetical protein